MHRLLFLVLLISSSMAHASEWVFVAQGADGLRDYVDVSSITGKIGRNRVCALHKPGVEIPSDIHGVLYVELDSGGGWKTKLAQELVQAKFDINLQGLLQG